MKINKLTKAAFTLVEIMIVVAIIGLLATIAIPNFVRARATAQKNACINNLRQLDGAIQQWAIEFNRGSNSPVTLDEIKPYIKLTSLQLLPPCPGGGTYSVTSVGANPACTLSGQDHKLP